MRDLRVGCVETGCVLPHVWAVGWQHIHDNVVVARVAVRLSEEGCLV